MMKLFIDLSVLTLNGECDYEILKILRKTT